MYCIGNDYMYLASCEVDTDCPNGTCCVKSATGLTNKGKCEPTCKYGETVENCLKNLGHENYYHEM